MSGKSSTYQYILVIFFILLFTALLVLNPHYYTILSNEDRLFEYLTAFGLLIAGIYLLKAGFAFRLKKTLKYQTIIFLTMSFVGVLFVVAAGEEISWGQRIFDLPTPDFLQPINDQGELNLHNIDKKFFDRIVDRATLVFVLICTIFFLRSKKELWNIPLPDLPMICLFAITAFYQQYAQWTLDFYNLNYIAFIALGIYAIKYKLTKEMAIVALALGISFLIPLIHRMFQENFHEFNNSSNEYREFLFSLACLFYSRYIYQSIKSQSA